MLPCVNRNWCLLLCFSSQLREKKVPLLLLWERMSLQENTLGQMSSFGKALTCIIDSSLSVLVTFSITLIDVWLIPVLRRPSTSPVCWMGRSLMWRGTPPTQELPSLCLTRSALQPPTNCGMRMKEASYVQSSMDLCSIQPVSLQNFHSIFTFHFPLSLSPVCSLQRIALCWALMIPPMNTISGALWETESRIAWISKWYWILRRRTPRMRPIFVLSNSMEEITRDGNLRQHLSDMVHFDSHLLKLVHWS